MVKMKRFWEKQILLALALVTLSGCVTYPIAKNLQQQARRVTLAQVRADPGAYQGTIVIWGGRIINTTNDVNSSAIYVLCLPLDGSGKPVLGADSPGRFIASSKEFLDPEVYKSGRLVTVAGSIVGLESQPVQNSRYNYPVLNIKQIHLWPAEPRYRYYYEPGWGWYYYPYPGWSWWYPGWGVRWNWYYGGYWGRDSGYRYQGSGWHENYNGGDRDQGGRGGSYHYQGGGGGGGGRGGGTGHWHRYISAHK